MLRSMFPWHCSADDNGQPSAIYVYDNPYEVSQERRNKVKDINERVMNGSIPISSFRGCQSRMYQVSMS